MSDRARLDGSEHLERMLGATVAQRVRDRRTDRGLTITQLAERAGISKGMLSKIENGQTSPSLGTIAALAGALEVPVTALFRGLEEEHDAIFVPAGQGIDIEHQGEDQARGHSSQMLGAMRGPDRLLEPLLVTLTEQTMEYGAGTARYVLNPGDALQFEGEVPHGPVALMELPIRFLSIKAYDAK